ncbi:MAG: 2-oxo acid dehydrogenase subunit E2 [Granulosicoccus sp.]
MSDATYFATPSVAAMALRMGVDLADVARMAGRIHIAREDVERHVTEMNQHVKGADSSILSTPSPNDDSRFWKVDHSTFGPVTEEPLSNFALTASCNLSAANRTIPQVTHHDRADLRAVQALRTRLKAEATERGIKLTILAFHVKALALCLEVFPQFNASLSANGKTLFVKHYRHIGIAVDTPHGLMVPVIRDVDRKGLWQIAEDISDLAARAQQRKVRPNEMGGASMTISNLGGIGGIGFTPIVNPPELAILGITRTETVPLWEDGNWNPVPMAPLDLSYDHRVINGALAARFVAHLASMLADPREMLV